MKELVLRFTVMSCDGLDNVLYVIREFAKNVFFLTYLFP